MFIYGNQRISDPYVRPSANQYVLTAATGSVTICLNILYSQKNGYQTHWTQTLWGDRKSKLECINLCRLTNSPKCRVTQFIALRLYLGVVQRNVVQGANSRHLSQCNILLWNQTNCFKTSKGGRTNLNCLIKKSEFDLLDFCLPSKIYRKRV